MSDLEVRIEAKSAGKTRTIAKARDFEIILDEPEEMGGFNSAPNPVEYLLAGLAGCLNVMGHLVAGEMGFELRNLNIEISGILDPAKAFGESDEQRAGCKSIVVTMIPECDVGDGVLQEWLHTVDSRCPVSDNIQNRSPLKCELGVQQQV
jgi:uncharacterized OsmC-like protein